MFSRLHVYEIDPTRVDSTIILLFYPLNRRFRSRRNENMGCSNSKSTPVVESNGGAMVDTLTERGDDIEDQVGSEFGGNS